MLESVSREKQHKVLKCCFTLVHLFRWSIKQLNCSLRWFGVTTSHVIILPTQMPAPEQSSAFNDAWSALIVSPVCSSNVVADQFSRPNSSTNTDGGKETLFCQLLRQHGVHHDCWEHNSSITPIFFFYAPLREKLFFISFFIYEHVHIAQLTFLTRSCKQKWLFYFILCL